MSQQAPLRALRAIGNIPRRCSAFRLGNVRATCTAMRSLTPQITTPYRAFTLCPRFNRGIMPETETPVKEVEPEATTTSSAIVELSDGEYHELADIYLDNVLAKFEELQDQKDSLDIEYSAGVMTITVPNKGTYIINKQPPNKQIWVSSPLSGPKRYDWCVIGEGQNEKEGTASGGWVYSRDGSSLSELIFEELGVVLESQLEK